MMNKEYIITLSQIFDALNSVQTEGKNTRIMGKCLDALEALLIEMSQQKENKEE